MLPKRAHSIQYNFLKCLRICIWISNAQSTRDESNWVDLFCVWTYCLSETFVPAQHIKWLLHSPRLDVRTEVSWNAGNQANVRIYQYIHQCKIYMSSYICSRLGALFVRTWRARANAWHTNANIRRKLRIAGVPKTPSKSSKSKQQQYYYAHRRWKKKRRAHTKKHIVLPSLLLLYSTQRNCFRLLLLARFCSLGSPWCCFVQAFSSQSNSIKHVVVGVVMRQASLFFGATEQRPPPSLKSRTSSET